MEANEKESGADKGPTCERAQPHELVAEKQARERQALGKRTKAPH